MPAERRTRSSAPGRGWRQAACWAAGCGESSRVCINQTTHIHTGLGFVFFFFFFPSLPARTYTDIHFCLCWHLVPRARPIFSLPSHRSEPVPVCVRSPRCYFQKFLLSKTIVLFHMASQDLIFFPDCQCGFSDVRRMSRSGPVRRVAGGHRLRRNSLCDLCLIENVFAPWQRNRGGKKERTTNVT